MVKTCIMGKNVVIFWLLGMVFLLMYQNGQLEKKDKLNEEFFLQTELKMVELRARADAMTNVCSQYLNDEWLLMDMGNDQSQ